MPSRSRRAGSSHSSTVTNESGAAFVRSLLTFLLVAGVSVGCGGGDAARVGDVPDPDDDAAVDDAVVAHVDRSDVGHSDDQADDPAADQPAAEAAAQDDADHSAQDDAQDDPARDDTARDGAGPVGDLVPPLGALIKTTTPIETTTRPAPPTTTTGTVGPVVHRGAFCKPAGATGISDNDGQLLACRTASDGRLRWRNAV